MITSKPQIMLLLAGLLASAFPGEEGAAKPAPKPFPYPVIPKSVPPARTLLGHDAPLTTAVLSADGRVLASAARDGSLVVWDVTQGAELRRYTGLTPASAWLSLSMDGRQKESSP